MVAELTNHLGHEHGEAPGDAWNALNDFTEKTVQTRYGSIELLDVNRSAAGVGFEPTRRGSLA